MVAATIPERFSLSIGQPRDDDHPIPERRERRRARAKIQTRRRHLSAASSRTPRHSGDRRRPGGAPVWPAYSEKPSEPAPSRRAAAAATVAPMPRSTVRREMAFLVTIMSGLSSSVAAGPHPRRLCLRHSARLGFGWIIDLLRAAHLKWRAFHNGQNRGRPAVVIG